MANLYHAYGLTFASEIELPELALAPDASQPPQVQISLGAVPPQGLEGGRQISPFIWVSDGQFWLEVPDIARFLVRDGAQIVVQPAPSIDMASVRVFLLGSGLGALLFQRGLLVLHGNAIEMGQGCLVCVGPSGVGKSTLTAAFMQRGYRVLADDVVPINDQGMAIPGFGRIKLWQDVADRLHISTDGLQRIRPQLEKFNLPLGDAFCDSPRKVVQICLLSEHLDDDITQSPVTGIEKFTLLRANTYRQRFMAGMALQPQHLQQCGALAGQVAITRVARPKSGFRIDDLVDALAAQMQGAR